jgi:pyruvate dehydrogenase E1 component alpha subunit
MNVAQVREALYRMIESRAIDDLVVKLQRLGRAGLYAPVEGQEASVVGSAMALDPDRDWLVPASREQPAMLRHGLPLENLFASYLGRTESAAIPPGVKLLPRQQAIAAQVPHAAGLAWAMELRGEEAVVLAYCGDGASSEGDFHEALNLAGVMCAPLVVVLINNRYAISTPVQLQTSAPNFAARAEGYGMPGVLADGNDVFAVYSATTAAVERALRHEGPTLIECRTYRLGAHNTSDNPRDYRDAAEVEAAQRTDPISRLEQYAVANGVMSENEISVLRSTVSANLRTIVNRVEAMPRPGAEFMFEHVYETLPPQLSRQRREVTEGN